MARIVEGAAGLPPHEAQAWVKDTLLLAEAGLVPVASALRVAEAAFAHSSANVRLAAVRLLEGLRQEWLRPAEVEALEKVVAARVQPIARELGWAVSPEDPADLRELRAALMPFAADRPSGVWARAEAHALGLRWLEDREAVDASMSAAVLATTGRFADGATFERLAAAAADGASERDRNAVLGALARVRDPALRERVLALPLDGRATFTLLLRMLRDDENRAAAFEHVRRNVPALEAKVPRDTLAALLEPMGRLCKPGQREALARAFSDRASHWMTGPLRAAR
jgi:hypothetical protein